jgi:hypothetical protein
MATTYEILSTTTIPGTAQLVTISSIPQGYTDLRVVATFNSLPADTSNSFGLRINGNTGNYNFENFNAGNGAPGYPTASRANAQPYFDLTYVQSQGNANNGIVTWDIFQYASTTMNKSVLYDNGYQSGVSTAQSSRRVMNCGLWENTAAVTSVSLLCIGNTLGSGTITLFGILKA